MGERSRAFTPPKRGDLASFGVWTRAFTPPSRGDGLSFGVRINDLRPPSSGECNSLGDRRSGLRPLSCGDLASFGVISRSLRPFSAGDAIATFALRDFLETLETEAEVRFVLWSEAEEAFLAEAGRGATAFVGEDQKLRGTVLGVFINFFLGDGVLSILSGVFFSFLVDDEERVRELFLFDSVGETDWIRFFGDGLLDGVFTFFIGEGLFLFDEMANFLVDKGLLEVAFLIGEGLGEGDSFLNFRFSDPVPSLLFGLVGDLSGVFLSREGLRVFVEVERRGVLAGERRGVFSGEVFRDFLPDLLEGVLSAFFAGEGDLGV